MKQDNENDSESDVPFGAMMPPPSDDSPEISQGDSVDENDLGQMEGNGTPSHEGRGLILLKGQLQLPCCRPIVSGSKKFTQIIKRVLPDEAPELLEAFKAKQDKPSRLSRIGLVAGLLLIILGVFHFWPQGKPLRDTSSVYEIPSQTSERVDKKYQELLADCERMMAKKQYPSCVEQLKPHLDEILKDQATFAQNSRLLSIYLNCNKLYLSADLPSLVKLCERALKYDASPEWQMFKLYFRWEPYKLAYLDYFDLLDAYQTTDASGRRRVAKRKEKEDRPALAQRLKDFFREAEKIRATLANYPETDETIKITLDKLRCQILIAQWIVEGYSNYPDDLGNAGVAAREKAYQIAKAYPNDIAFLKLRREIAKRILDQDHWYYMNFYYFDGNERFSASYLEDAINEIDNDILQSKQIQLRNRSSH